MAGLLDKHLPFDEVRRLDARLSALGRGQAALRLRVGELAEVLGIRGWFGELGFSRVGDYARERCGHTSGWLRESRTVARKMADLPALRAALCGGELSWSMAELCARKTTPEREAEVLERGKTSTVRQMKRYFGKVTAASPMPDMQPEPNGWASWGELDQLGICDEEGTGARCDKGTTAPVDLRTTCTAFSSVGFLSGAFASGGFASASAAASGTRASAAGASGTRQSAAGASAAGASGTRQSAAGASDTAAFASAALDPAASDPAAPDSAPLDRGASASRGEGGGLEIEAAVGDATELDHDIACDYDRAVRRTIQRTVSEAVVYKFEATRILLDHLESGSASPDEIMEAMLVEAQTKLQVDVDLAKMEYELQCADETRRKWLRTKHAMDDAAQASCESRLPDPEPADAILEAKPIPDRPAEIDAEIVGLCQRLAFRDVEMGQLAEAIIVANGWRRMGLSSLRQYAHERVGVSQRTLEQKIKLARKVRQFPAIGEALQGGKINTEAALRVGGIASEETLDAWIERASRRTVKHLDEEIEGVRRLIRLGAPHDGGPPDEAALEAAFQMERMVVSGELLKNNDDTCSDGDTDEDETFESAGGAASTSTQMSGTSISTRMSGASISTQMSGASISTQMSGASISTQMSGASTSTQMSGALDGASSGIAAMLASTAKPMGAGGTPDPGALLPKDPIDALLAARPWKLQFYLSESNYIRWIALEAAYEPHAKVTGKSFLEFMLEAVWEVWGPRFQRTQAYQDIYVRDRYRCSNPVCRKRTLTPHHLVYRSQGGTDDPENLTTLCYDCHLLGVHLGRIAVAPPASTMRWVIGRTATLIVQGREKIEERTPAEIRLIKPPPKPEAA